MNYLKAEVIKTGKYRVLALPFGGPLKGRDLDGQYFSERTDPKPDWFNERPALFHHGLDHDGPGDDKVGHQGPLERGREGWWADTWVEKQNRYFAMIDNLIGRGRMFGSSGTMPHLIKASSDGELLVWPHVEQTLSPLPRNPYSVVRATKALEDFSGLDLEKLQLLANLEDFSSDLQLTSEATPGDVAARDALKASLDELEHIIRRVGGYVGSGDHP